MTAGQNNYYGLNTTLGYSANVVPAIYNTGFKNGQPYSDINLEDGTFVRLQNVTLGYDFGSLLKEGTTLRFTLPAKGGRLRLEGTGAAMKVRGVETPARTCCCSASIRASTPSAPRASTTTSTRCRAPLRPASTLVFNC